MPSFGLVVSIVWLDANSSSDENAYTYHPIHQYHHESELYCCLGTTGFYQRRLASRSSGQCASLERLASAGRFPKASRRNWWGFGRVEYCQTFGRCWTYSYCAGSQRIAGWKDCRVER
jgi:hypothetical protein